MAHKIREHSGIHGITMNNLEHIIAQFADDTQLFLNNRKSLENVIATLDEVEANTGLKVNYEKTAIYTIGQDEAGANSDKICSKPIVWDPGGLTVLGVDIIKCVQAQYMQILDKAKEVLDVWYLHNLTLCGKILLINTLVVSLFVYNLRVLENPKDEFYDKFDLLVERFLEK